MKVVSDSSPLITLARIGCLDLLPMLYGRIMIASEVYKEVVIDGVGLPGAAQVEFADWIETRRVKNAEGMALAVAKSGLGSGEVSAVFLAKELSAELTLIDERRARRFARAEGLPVIGCVGILEDLHVRGYLNDLRGAYQRLIQEKSRVDLRTIQNSLAKFKLRPL